MIIEGVQALGSLSALLTEVITSVKRVDWGCGDVVTVMR